MPNIRLKAATQGGLALDVSARTASSSHLDAGVSLVVEPQDSEIFLAADPVITEVIYRASARALQHEIFMTYEAIPVINLPAETIVTSDSIGPFIIGFNPSETPTVTDLPAFTIGLNSLADSATVTDLPTFELGRALSDSFSLTDAPSFEVGRSLDDSFNTSDSIGPFVVGFNPSDTPTVDEDDAKDIVKYLGETNARSGIALLDSKAGGSPNANWQTRSWSLPSTWAGKYIRYLFLYNAPSLGDKSDIAIDTIDFAGLSADFETNASGFETQKHSNTPSQNAQLAQVQEAYETIANGSTFRKFGPVEPHDVFKSAGEWVINSGTTPTAQTGPNSAHSGSNYLYAENSPLFGSTTARSIWLRSEVVQLPQSGTISGSYKLSRFGTNIGSLYVYAIEVEEPDSVTITDAPAFAFTTAFADSYTAIDVFTSTVQYSRQFTDSVSMLDQFASTVVKPIDTNLSTAAVDPDPVVMSDAPAMTFGFNSLSDSATVTDSPAFTVGTSLSDSATPTDSPTFTVARPLADSASASDIPALSVGLNSLADNFTLSDIPVFSLTSNLTDSMSVSENIVLQQNKSVVDSISASDNTYEIGASFEGDGGLFNSATLIGSSPPFNEEFALQTFST